MGFRGGLGFGLGFSIGTVFWVIGRGTNPCREGVLAFLGLGLGLSWVRIVVWIQGLGSRVSNRS